MLKLLTHFKRNINISKKNLDSSYASAKTFFAGGCISFFIYIHLMWGSIYPRKGYPPFRTYRNGGYFETFETSYQFGYGYIDG